MFKFHNKYRRMAFWCFYCNFEHYFTPFFSISIGTLIEHILAGILHYIDIQNSSSESVENKKASVA